MDPTRGSTRGQIHAIAQAHRRELLRGERAAASEMVRAYGQIWQRLRQEIVALSTEYNAAAKANAEISPDWVLQYGRLDALQDQVEAEMRRFAAQADELIQVQQQQAVMAAQQHSAELVAAQGAVSVSWNRLATGAITDLVGFTRDGSPLRALLDQLGPQASQAVRDGLIEGLALGQNPTAIARRIRGDLGGDLAQALKISRTTVINSYREATLRGYQANDDLVVGWKWVASKSSRTCIMCLMMDGTIHGLDEHLDDHPNGRCTMIPVLRGQEAPEWETGETWFEKQAEAMQRGILGNAGYEAYRGGAVTLRDFVGQRQSAAWGSTRYARSLVEMLGDDEAQRWRGIARAVMGGPESSQHPADQMIRRMIAAGTTPAAEEWGEIAAHLGNARFSVRSVRIDPAIRGQTFQGEMLGTRAPSITAHLAKRVLVEQQWAPGTTTTEYLDDLRFALQNSNGRVAIYQHRDGRYFLSMLAPNSLPATRLGPKPERYIWVAYDASHGTITTGYQVSGVQTLDLPEAIRWLK